MSKAVKLSDLSTEEIRALRRQVRNEDKANEKKVRVLREGYKETVNKVVPDLFTELMAVSQRLSEVKTKVFDGLKALVAQKSEVYDREQDQNSHSFSTEEGITIIIGNRQIDGWDDTAEVGVQKVTDFITSLGKDDNSKSLVKTILQLLSKDKSGQLKLSRVLQLKKLSEEVNNKGFKDAIQIIQDAYRPVASRQFVTCRFKDTKGVNRELPLSITDADLLAVNTLDKSTKKK